MSIPSLEALREQRAALVAEVNEIRTTATTEDRDLSEDELRTSNDKLDEVEKIDARIKTEERAAPHLKPAMTQKDAAEERDASPVLDRETKSFARPKDWRSEELTYRPDNFRESNFWADMLEKRNGSTEARERLEKNVKQAKSYYEQTRGRDYAAELESRDMGAGSTAGGDFLPPLYLADLWVHPNMAGRPLADRLPKYPLPPTGRTITIPQLSSGVSVAARDTGGSVSETDGVTATITHTVQEYAGLVDIDRIAVMRSDPGLQDVITRTLVRRYNVALDTDLISGSGTTPHHKGLDNVVTGTNDVTWTQASPTPAKFSSQILNAASQINTNRIEVVPDIVVMHGRRAMWATQPNSSTFAIVQQGGLYHVQGTQDNGFVEMISGLEVVRDNNITTTAGSGTNQDKVYVLASEDFLLAEGPLYARVHEDVGSGAGAIRFAVFAFSAFLSSRYPSSVARISGTGLAAATFDS